MWVACGLFLATSFLAANPWEKQVAAELEKLDGDEKRIAEYLIDGNVPGRFDGKDGAVTTSLDAFRILQVIDSRTVIATTGGRDYFLTGVRADKWADDDVRTIKAPMMVVGTKSYETVLGAQRTIRKVVVLSQQGQDAVYLSKEGKNYRVFATKDGEAFGAVFRKLEKGVAYFDIEPGRGREIKMTDLSEDSKDWIRKKTGK